MGRAQESPAGALETLENIEARPDILERTDANSAGRRRGVWRRSESA